jgi:hypothetical protein
VGHAALCLGQQLRSSASPFLARVYVWVGGGGGGGSHFKGRGEGLCHWPDGHINMPAAWLPVPRRLPHQPPSSSGPLSAPRASSTTSLAARTSRCRCGGWVWGLKPTNNKAWKAKATNNSRNGLLRRAAGRSLCLLSERGLLAKARARGCGRDILSDVGAPMSGSSGRVGCADWRTCGAGPCSEATEHAGASGEKGPAAGVLGGGAKGNKRQTACVCVGAMSGAKAAGGSVERNERARVAL